MKSFSKTYFEPSFLLCVAVLAIAAAYKGYAVNWLGMQLIKRPIPLQKSLDLLDKSALLPYNVVNEAKIENKDILEQLGTEEYIQWSLEDSDLDTANLIRPCSLFITYYTGTPDQVPHVPEECHWGAGNKQESNETLSLDIGKDKKLKVRHLVFESKASNNMLLPKKYSVLYFFHVNGKYASSRLETRAILGENLFGKYSYFSKVELTFPAVGGIDGSPEKQQVIEAGEKLFRRLLPVMEKDHWPDWEKASRENLTDTKN